MTRAVAVLAALALVAVLCGQAVAGSTEPSLAVAAVTASVDEGAVTLIVTANYDHQNVVRLGYPVTIVVTAGATVARLGLDGVVTVEVPPDPPAPVPGAPGVVAIAPERLTAVLPPALASAGAASVRLEADYDGELLRSNAAPVTW
ncbi:MAG: hypothetical protein IT294_11565 [Deltaproteobacteria bacterium]|nr:hypothetical protein [Deltaproteobacteria bacterium]